MKPLLHGYNQGLILLFSLLMVVGGFVFYFIFTVLAMVVMGIPLSQLQEMYNSGMNDSNMHVFKTLQIIQSVSIFILPALLASFFIARKPLNYLLLTNNINAMRSVLCMLAIIMAIPLINYLALLNQQLKLPSIMAGTESWMHEKENFATEVSMMFLNVKTWEGLVLNILMIGVLPAIGEEMVFRGLIQKPLMKLTGNQHTAVLITAFLFALVHFQFFTFLPRFALGIYLGYLLVWSGNLWYPVLAHFANNTFIVVAYYFLIKSGKDVNMDTIGLSQDYFMYSLTSISFMVLFIYLFRKYANLDRRSV